MNTAGRDIASIQCYQPTGCCAPSPCVITLDEFICQIRSLLPEGDLYNNTLPPAPPTTDIAGIGAAVVGCSTVGNQQLVIGGCCGPDAIICDVIPTAPQLAVFDSFAAVAYESVQALCQMLPELDPCSASFTLRRWCRRFGIVTGNLCDPQSSWSDHTLSVLLCVMTQVHLHVINLDYLHELAARFGSSMNIHFAGDMNCGPVGWWTMARDHSPCDPAVLCPSGDGYVMAPPDLPDPACDHVRDSINIVLCPTDITIPPNCNFPPLSEHLPHDPELYEAFKWLLPQILPMGCYWCIYECDPPNCIV